VCVCVLRLVETRRGRKTSHDLLLLEIWVRSGVGEEGRGKREITNSPFGSTVTMTTLLLSSILERETHLRNSNSSSSNRKSF
jgi:hypothetical protein